MKPKMKEADESDQDKFGADEEQDEKEGDEMAKKKKMDKSEDVSTDDLQKSLDKLEDFAKSEDTVSRKDALLTKAAEDELSKSEHAELFELLGGGELGDVEVDESITKSLTDNEPLQKSLDVSSYLQESHDALVKSLGAVGEIIESSDLRRHNFAMLQAKALVGIGTMVKSLAETVDTMASAPATGPKSAGLRPGTKTLQKSFAGQPPAESQMSTEQVLNGLDQLMEKSMDAGQGGRLSTTNEDISLAVAKFEGSGQISPSMLAAVKGLNQGSAH